MEIPRFTSNIAPKEAIELQKKTAHKIRFEPLHKCDTVAGVDVAFNKSLNQAKAAVCILDSTFTILEKHTCVTKITFPYIPGLLSFREIPAILKVLKKLRTDPDVIMCDGHGYAHPRRLGLATHLGILLNMPTIGIAKSRLTGSCKEPGITKGSYTKLYDKNEIIGACLRSKDKTKPLYISVGNKMTLNNAIDITLKFAAKYRLPEPTRIADKLSKIR